jgi:hypothetical protein
VYHTMVSHENQRSQNLRREAPNQDRGESGELIRLDQLVQVHAEQFHYDAQMVTEIEVFVHSNNVMFVVGILDAAMNFTVMQI